MKKQEWLLIFLPLVVVWYLDRMTKSWAVGLTDIQSYGFLHFALHHNPGAMLGLFSDLPPVLRIVSLSTGGAFLVVIYALIQYLLPIKSLILRSGMSILLGGILGNVTDRILWGHVVDFIILGKEGFSSPAFNLADALQWFGYAMIVYAVTKDGEILWPENNNRKRFWINMKFQLKYCYMLLGVGFSISLIALVFSYTYMKVVLTEFVGNNPMVLERFLTPFIVTFAVISLAFSIGLFTVGKVISHKIAGPIYAFDKYMREMMEAEEKGQESRTFKLRTNDEFKELEYLAHQVKNKFSNQNLAGQKTTEASDILPK
jgi:signal peptidase II